MVTWIETNVKTGDSIKFKGDDKWWYVEQTYPHEIEKTQINYSWKVGGL
jgi:hypothetical protein